MQLGVKWDFSSVVGGGPHLCSTMGFFVQQILVRGEDEQPA